MTCNDYSIMPIDDDPEFDAAKVAAAIDYVEGAFAAMLKYAVASPSGDTVSIACRRSDAIPGKFYGPHTHLVLEAARLWHDHLKEEQAADDLFNPDDHLNMLLAQAAPAPAPAPAPVPTKTVYRVLVSCDGETQDANYFLPYDTRRGAFAFAATLDPETFDEVGVVEDEIPADATAFEDSR